MSTKEAIMICDHMNKDHQIALYDYNNHYSTKKLRVNNPNHSVKLTDVTTDKFTLLCSNDGKTSYTYDIPFEPPLKSLSEVRVRFITMAFSTADEIHRSPYQIKEFQFSENPVINYANASVALLAFGVLAAFLLSLTPLSSYSPFWAKAYQYLKVTIPLMYIAHLSEYFLVVKTILIFHRVPYNLGTLYFWATFFFGFAAWLPLKHKSDELKERKKSQYARLLGNAK